MRQLRPFLPWAVWGVAVLAYAISVVNRSSLAALGPAAQDHFGIDATVLALFPVIQLIVYASLQIPVGILVDRYGPSLLILTGGMLMVIGQLVMATVADVGLAILARVLVGAGDACTFISVMRLLPEWFAVRHLPTLSQVTGLIGQAGQLVSVTPLALAVSVFGWTNGFLGVATATLLLAVLGTVVIRDRPGGGTAFERLTGRLGRRSRDAEPFGPTSYTGVVGVMPPPPTEMITAIPRGEPSRQGFWRKFRRILGLPGVRLAYWIHFTSPLAINTFVLLWGTPFLMGGLGFSQGAAGALLSLTVVSSMTAGMLLGPISSRFIERRVWINVSITIALATAWIAVLVWPGQPPLWVVIAMLVIMPVGGPASMIAFEVLRSHSPRSISGFATGLANTGGFTSSLLVILLIGFVLDVQGAGAPEHYSLGAFRWAFAVQVPLWALGLTMILIERRRTMRWMAKHGRTLR